MNESNAALPTPCPDNRDRKDGETSTRPASARGYALIIALLAMLVLSAVIAAIMASVTVNTRGTDLGVRRIQSLSVAEAGVVEAEARLSSGEIPDNGNPAMVSVIYLCKPGQVPVSDVDTVSLATSQPTGKWLNYSTPDKDPDALTVQYKTDASRTHILRYDPALMPPIQTASGAPIFSISSTSHRGDAMAKVVAEGFFKPVVPNLNAVVSGHASTTKLWCGAIDHGPFVYNGMNHRIDTPTDAGEFGPDPENYLGTGDIPGFWCTGPITWGPNRAKGVCCDPMGEPQPVMENQPATSYYAGPWSALTMSQADFYKAIGTPLKTVPATLDGIVYLDNNNIQRDASGSWTLNNVSGSGLLYVDGDLKVTGDFHWRGLIFTEGTLDLGGNIWVLGGLIINDPSQLAIQHVRATFLYSRQAIAECLKRGNGFATLSWREFP